MNKRLLILGALAVGFAGTTIAAAEWWLRNNIETVVVEKQVGAERAAQFTTIAVAAEEMRYGTVLDTTLIKEIAWPKDSLPEGAFADAQELLADGRRVALYPIAPNEPILSTKISGSDDKPSLSRILEEGKRA
ncbi:MAG: SAF domain-containing protein, partial [Pseudomonadota bacterium]